MSPAPKIFALAALLLSGAMVLKRSVGAEGPPRFSGKVVRVSDGDTIIVLRDHRGVKVRLAEIDCPELSQPFGRRAKEFTSKQVSSQVVRVEVTTTDRYGRLVGEVFGPDGTSLNRALVGVGLAWQYNKYSKSADLAVLEEKARAARIGLWADKEPIPPWIFRRSRR